MTNQSFRQYVKNVRKVQWFIYVIPVGAWALKGNLEKIFPVVGDEGANIGCLTLVMIVAGVGAILPWAINVRKTGLVILLSSLVLLISSTVAYFDLTQRYLISVPTPHGKLTVSVGSVRSSFANDVAKDACPQYGCTDAELLTAEGPYEDRVHKLWTEDSIIRVRLKMAGSYAAVIFLLNFIIGIFAKQDQHSRTQPSKP